MSSDALPRFPTIPALSTDSVDSMDNSGNVENVNGARVAKRPPGNIALHRRAAFSGRAAGTCQSLNRDSERGISHGLQAQPGGRQRIDGVRATSAIPE